MSKKQKIWLKISGAIFIVGIVLMMIAAYFLIQSIRESFYQSSFEKRYEFTSLQEDGSVDTVQVFHGVKINTYVEEESDPPTIILEINDEEEAELKGYEINVDDEEGMKAFSGGIQYKLVTDTTSGKEEFIVSLLTSPANESESSATYRTYTINENGIVKKSDFTTESKSKLETQWIRGISKDTHGYYTDLPYQDGGTSSLWFLSFMGLLFMTGGFWLGRTLLINKSGAAA
ncbi:hypothetical protein HF072_02485 [Bacillus sp. RO3]|nr:hypothetical protein [Bacillus sp. RO3]